jgi:hypothetical protein
VIFSQAQHIIVNIEAKKKNWQKRMQPATREIARECIYALAPLSCFGVTSLWSRYRWAEVGRPGGAFSKGVLSSAPVWEHLLPVYKVEMS